MSQVETERRSTTPERWEPVNELEQMTQRMRQMLEQTFGGFGFPSALLTEASGWSPLVDIEEQDDAYVLEAELPGVNREDVNIEVVGNELMITGEIKERERKENAPDRALRIPRQAPGPGRLVKDRREPRPGRPHRPRSEVGEGEAPEDRGQVEVRRGR
jgi:HSP20 family molecular chaperone IbpA